MLYMDELKLLYNYEDLIEHLEEEIYLLKRENEQLKRIIEREDD